MDGLMFKYVIVPDWTGCKLLSHVFNNRMRHQRSSLCRWPFELPASRPSLGA
jgi:hypothetical protein